ncbi:MAG: hypothetical protein AB9880_06085 [Christensenellales bacterium]
MLIFPYLLVYLACGCLLVRWLLPGQRPLYRLWLGLSLGLFLLMWLPALVAFLHSFSLSGHLLALLPLAALTGAGFLLRDKRTPLTRWNEEDARDLRVLLMVALPLTLLGGYLQWTHDLRPAADGLWVGQSTYGDLPLHTGIITSLRDARFPADYSILPGERLAYPFLADSLSTSFLLFGLSLQAALVIPGTLMMALVFFGFPLLALRLANRRRAAVLAALLFFLNGGLGFLYSLDMAGVSLGQEGMNQLQAGTWLDRLGTILGGWYQTPVNHAEFTTYNLRWSNVIADMFLPQRTFLGGWTVLLPCLYLLYDGLHRRGRVLRQFALLGLLAGGLPLLHTHSFLALGLCSLGWMVLHIKQRRGLLPWIVYGGLTMALALPQLIGFTFAQSSSTGFLRLQFNWVNNSGGQGIRDGYLWFYLKNIGLPFLLLILSLFEKNRKHRGLFAGAFLIFLAAEFIIFQPNEYDNNKLFYVWYALCLVPVSEYAFQLYDRLSGLRARPLMAVLCCLVFFLSGSLSLARETVSGFQAFGATAVGAAAFVEKETPPHSTFLSWTQHLNPVSALAGRNIVCGPATWLYYHGFDLSGRETQIAAFYRDPRGNRALLDAYQVSYILLGPYERNELTVDREALDALFEQVYADMEGDYIIYRVPP